MTDIQRHLKGIRKLLQFAIERAQHTQNHDLQVLREELQRFLPKSYGIGTGRITGATGTSEPVQLLLYDVPLAGGYYPEDTETYPIEHVLFVLDSALNYDVASLQAAIQRIASVKRLQTFRDKGQRHTDIPFGQKRRLIPKDRLPFALIYCDQLGDYLTDDTRIFTQIHDILKVYPVAEQPDQIDIIGQSVQYQNPLLERKTAHEYDISLSRTPDLKKPNLCYACKQKYFRQHFFYTDLCLPCGDLNFQKRIQRVDLTGYRALVTGARVKIGYATVLHLLRAGVDVIATSRFPRDMAQRYMQEPDFMMWRDRLHIYGIDLRQIGQLETFIHHLHETYDYLDVIINNAAQTVKRPANFYAHLLPFETAEPETLPDGLISLLGSDVTQTDYLQPSLAAELPIIEDAVFPQGEFDEHGQQVDNRDFNSWVMRLEDVPPHEMLEVHVVNAIAPAILAGQLKTLLQKSPHEQRLIINVSAAEGRFAQHKNGYHPHTNMAKAAMNMLSRTIAEDYFQSHIIVTSVDPGWVSDQVPRTGDDSRAVAAERLPIDMLDAAARICDPLFLALQSRPVEHGKLYKDYRIVDW